MLGPNEVRALSLSFRVRLLVDGLFLVTADASIPRQHQPKTILQSFLAEEYHRLRHRRRVDRLHKAEVIQIG